MLRKIFVLTLLLGLCTANAASLVNITDGKLYRYDLDTGVLNFPFSSTDIVGTSITAGGGTIYGYAPAGPDSAIQKYSVETGAYSGDVPNQVPPELTNPDSYIYGDGRIWSYNKNALSGFGIDVQTGDATNLVSGADTDLLAYGQDTLFTYGTGGYVYTSDASTGLPTAGNGYFSVAGLSGDSLVYGDGMLFGSNGAGFINKYDALSGNYLGQFSVAGTLSSSLIYGDGIIYSGTADGELWQYDATNGAYLGAVNLPSSLSFDANAWTFAPTVVPIPAAVWLFGSGLAALGFVRRKTLRNSRQREM